MMILLLITGQQRYQLLGELFVKDNNVMFQSSLQVGLNNVEMKYPLLKTELMINYLYKFDDNNDREDDDDDDDDDDININNNDNTSLQDTIKNVSEIDLDNLYISLELIKSIYNIPMMKINYNNIDDFIKQERNIYTSYVILDRDRDSNKNNNSKSNDKKNQDTVKIIVNKNNLDLFNTKYSIWRRQ